MPVSVAIDERERRRLAREGQRRGLGLSPTIRTLAIERLEQIEADQERLRAATTVPRKFLAAGAGRSGHHDTARRIEEILRDAFSR